MCRRCSCGGVKRPLQGRAIRIFLAYLVVALLCQWSVGTCLGGDAVFTNDGQRGYAIGYAGNRQVLPEINLTKQTNRTISLRQLPAQEPLLGITRSDGDKPFCITERNLWTFV
jgi:hypothetical protein